MSCINFSILRIQYPKLTFQNICGISVDWGAYIDIFGRKYVDKNGLVYLVKK